MYNKSIEEVYSQMNTAPDGLSEESAKLRLEKDGKNKLAETKKKSLFVKFLLQFKETMVLVLLGAAIFSAAVSIIEKDPSELIDTFIILLIVIINAVIGLVQESKAEKEMEALKNLSLPYAKVIRGGQTLKIKSEDLVVGDVVVMEAGDIIPADLRITESASLKIQESALTGESVPSEKNTDIISGDAALGDRKNMAYSSGTVAYGRGKGVVVATGMNTEIGKIAQMLTQGGKEMTPLQKKLDSTGKVISIGVLIIAAIIFVAGLFSTAEHTGNIYVESIMRAIAIAVAAIPEGLPAVVTIVMAFGVQRLSGRKAIIRKLPAVETLGCTEIICSDKTGTLTLNKMTVKNTFVISKNASKEDYRELYNCMTLCNDSTLSIADSVVTTTGDPTETALIEYSLKEGVNKNEYDTIFRRTDEVPFDSERKLMSVVVEKEDVKTVYTKGAVDELLKICVNILDGQQVRPLNEKDKEEILTYNKSLGSQALRVLGYAFKAFEGGEIESGLTFIGLTGMIDPPRPEVKAAIETCHKAGITAIMITGDHRDTAAAIARELGMITDDSQVISGKELDAMDDEQYLSRIRDIRVYARVSPENKVRIVKTWKKLGKVVAMTGDGVNDAPSIKAADIGIGMGITGTDVTKGVADMVLADDNFATIVIAVEEGRKIFSNIQKTIQFLLGANIAEVLSLFIVTIFFRHLSFLVPIQLLWVNLVTDTFPALALSTEKAEKDIMDVPPRKAQANMFAGKLGVNIIYQGIIQTIIILVVFLVSVKAYGNAVATTMAMLTLCFIQLFHAYNIRSDKRSLFSIGVFSNKMMNIAFLAGAALCVCIVALPFLNPFFGTVQLNWIQWLISIGAGFSIIPLIEIVKLCIRLVNRRKSHAK